MQLSNPHVLYVSCRFLAWRIGLRRIRTHAGMEMGWDGLRWWLSMWTPPLKYIKLPAQPIPSQRSVPVNAQLQYVSRQSSPKFKMIVNARHIIQQHRLLFHFAIKSIALKQQKLEMIVAV